MVRMIVPITGTVYWRVTAGRPTIRMKREPARKLSPSARASARRCGLPTWRFSTWRVSSHSRMRRSTSVDRMIAASDRMLAMTCQYSIWPGPGSALSSEGAKRFTWSRSANIGEKGMKLGSSASLLGSRSAAR